MPKVEGGITNKRDEIVECAYKLFIRKGLEETSIRDIAKISGLNINSIYYYFRTKADIVICCVEYGLKLVIERLFSEAIESDWSESEAIVVFTEKALEVKDELCWCYQVIASPNYNWLVKNIVNQVRGQYKKYIEKLCKKNLCDSVEYKNMVRIVVLIVKDFIITEDKRCIQQLETIIEQMKKIK